MTRTKLGHSWRGCFSPGYNSPAAQLAQDPAATSRIRLQEGCRQTSASSYCGERFLPEPPERLQGYPSALARHSEPA